MIKNILIYKNYLTNKKKEQLNIKRNVTLIKNLQKLQKLT